MRKTALDEELSDPDYAQIERMLARVKGGKIVNVETLDGFLTALVICPDLILPSEYLPKITSGETEDDDLVLESTDEARRFYGLLMRYWNEINREFQSGDIHMPFLLEDADSVAYGNDWAKGFLEGTHLRHEIWTEVANDEERGGAFVPIWALAYEHAEDPSIRPFKEPVTPKKREDLIVAMIAGLKRLYEGFEKDRKSIKGGNLFSPSFGPKVGRNDQCPCGSGKKFKKCCGQTTFH